jgi:hypothetical protein
MYVHVDSRYVGVVNLSFYISMYMIYGRRLSMKSGSKVTKLSRLVATTSLGAIFGVICMFLSRYTADVGFWPVGVSLLLHHTALGFAIGASSLKMIWAVHGILWGAIFGLFLAISFVGRGTLQPWIAFVMPVVWGFLIEILASQVFKQPQYR